ncbi:hypothetical protein WA026_002290 [Henosepilachna vigintioctopunctata]|uniref:Uncharacterized protein n=1 Tax=Henosepilachna vigintioctopunctata TaxID=420089 RepID=A0AAW1TZZ3_9CUCU
MQYYERNLPIEVSREDNIRSSEIQSNEILNEETRDLKIVIRNIYHFASNAVAFLTNKVMLPFGEYLLTNSTLWVVLKCIVEVVLEMLLYIILAICYVFLKLITQMEEKKKLKSIPSEHEKSVTPGAVFQELSNC